MSKKPFVITDVEIRMSKPIFSTGEKKLSISITDRKSSSLIFEAYFPLDQLAEMLLGVGARGEGKVYTGDHIGKQLKVDKITFPIPDCDYGERKAIAIKEAEKYTPEGWVADQYYGSQDSFYQQDGQYWARVNIRTYV